MSDTADNKPSKPEGADFVIGQVDFNDAFAQRLAIEYEGRIPEDRIQSWPMVYILSNEEEAYVGQTTSLARRMSQHGSNPEKKAFRKVNAIYNQEFNASVVLDYEHRLIDLMQGDGHFCLTNKNSGLSSTNYFSRDAYAAMFDELWDDLRAMELVDNSIDTVEQSEAFKFSPFKVLTADQEVALQSIVAAISERLLNGDSDASTPIVVQGMPGTGKTVLAISLLKVLKDLAVSNDPEYAHFRGINVRLLEPVTGLRQTIQRALRKTVNLDESDIIGPNDLGKHEFGCKPGGKGFDVALIDEAHKLSQRKNMPPLQYKYYDGVTAALGLQHGAPQIDWVLDQVRIPVFFYDPLQIIGPKSVGEAMMADRLGEALERPIELYSQMRVKGGAGYLDYVRRLLFDEKPAPMAFDGYDLVLHTDFREFENLFEETLKHHSLTRMAAGFAWKWKTKDCKDPKLSDIEIDGVGKRWNRTFRDWVGRGTDNPDIAHEVGCIHSVQGYDLSHAFVIIGEDLSYNVITQTLQVDKKSYCDTNGKRNASTEDLDRYVRNIYYVLMTRGIEATHLYVCDPALREYFAKYMTTC